MDESADEPWYVRAFGDDYRTVYSHRDLQSARREVAGLQAAELLGCRVLDLCCGFGRHTLALLEQGVDAYGLDLSAELLRRARELPRASELCRRLVRADTRAIPFGAASFDGLVNLFSSFGYFDEEGDARVLSEVARVLRAGGRAILDLMSPDFVRARIVPRTTTERDGVVLDEVRSLVDGGRRVIKQVTVDLEGGRRRSWTEDVRLYSVSDVARIAAPRGLEVVSVLGGFSGEPAGPSAPRQIVVLRRTEAAP